MIGKIDLRRINNERFTIRFVHVCRELKIKTVHSARKILTNDIIGTKISRYYISQKIINEINNFK